MAYLPLSTANLPDPAIDPAQGSSPEDYFDILTYTGDGQTSQEIDGLSFTPDFLWIKERNDSASHQLHDVLRTAGTALFSNLTNAEITSSTYVQSFDSDGFTVGDSGGTNELNKTYVGWNWKANGSGVSNTDGTITSTVSANTDSGFSIVSYAGNSVAGATVGHGLGVTPDMIIVKSRTATAGYLNWGVYHKDLGATKAIYLNTTGGASTASGPWNNTAPTSSVFSLGNDGGYGFGISGQNYIAYCFSEVDGFSKFGSYTGNGSTDGPFVYTGFRPAFVMVKGSTFTSNWNLVDDARNTFNITDNILRPNLPNVEIDGSAQGANSLIFDFLSNGFKLRYSTGDINGSSQTFIYMAFAENPFKYSNAR